MGREHRDEHELEVSRYEARLTIRANEVAVLRHALSVLTAAIQKYDVPPTAPVIQKKAYSELCEALFRAISLIGVEEAAPKEPARTLNMKTAPTVSFAVYLGRKRSNRKPSGGNNMPPAEEGRAFP
jgi:hypothetical protein